MTEQAKELSEPTTEAWMALVAYAYADNKDGARVIQEITTHYLQLRAELRAAVDAMRPFRDRNYFYDDEFERCRAIVSVYDAKHPEGK